MQRLQLPQLLDDIRYKITVLEDRLQLIEAGIELYNGLAADATEPLQQYQYKELAAQKVEEHIRYDQQIRSQKVYLTEFENDLKQQQELRKKQLDDVNQHAGAMVKKAKSLLRGGKLSKEDQTVLSALRDQFVKDQFAGGDDEKIMRFKDLVRMLKKYGN